VFRSQEQCKRLFIRRGGRALKGILVQEQYRRLYGWIWMVLCLWLAIGGAVTTTLFIRARVGELASTVDIWFAFALLQVVLGSIGAVAGVALRRGVGASWNWIRLSASGLFLSRITALLVAQVVSIQFLVASGIGVAQLIQYVVLDVLDKLAPIVLFFFAVLITERKDNRDIFLGEPKARPFPDKDVWP
jgi:hypothetical protein